MRFSIIVMTYQKFDNLESNFKSIAAQSFQDFEVILSDDGSESFRPDVIKSIASESGIWEKLKVFHNKENLGTVKNYNAAIKKSNGEIIVPLSQDDTFADENVLRDLNNFFEQKAEKICLSKRVTDQGNVLPAKEDFEVLKDRETSHVLLNLTYRNFIYGATLYFWREVWEEFGGFDERCRLLEDYPFALKALSRGMRIVPFERVMIKYNEKGISREDGCISGAYLTLIRDHVALWDFFVKEELRKVHSLTVRRALQYHWKISFEAYKNPEKRKSMKFLCHLLYPDVSIWHKVYEKKYGSKCESYFAKRLVEKEYGR